MDSRNVICWIKADLEEGNRFSDDIMECKRLIHMPWTCKIKFIPRQANEVADCLAKVGHLLGISDVMFDDPPPGVDDLFI